MRSVPSDRTRPRRGAATAVGSVAIALWSALALLTVWAGGLPPLQLLASAFGVAFVGSAALLLLRGGSLRAALRQPGSAWLLGVAGLFGFHALYFVALRHAPAVEASLIAHLWPLLIVLFSAALPGSLRSPGERLRWFHCAGALLGALGAGLLVTGGHRLTLRPEHGLGYAAALGCAVTWAGYSVLNRRHAEVGTSMVVGLCGVVALLGLAGHLLLEQTVPPDSRQWLAIAGLGMGPMGGAFFAWDHGTKHGNLPLLGALSYLAPLLSTLLLIVSGHAEATAVLGAACLLIVGGALLATRGGRER